MLRTTVVRLQASTGAHSSNSDKTSASSDTDTDPVKQLIHATDNSGNVYKCGAFVANASYWKHSRLVGGPGPGSSSPSLTPSQYQISRVCVFSQALLANVTVAAGPTALFNHVRSAKTTSVPATSSDEGAAASKHHLMIIPPHTAPFFHSYAVYVTQLTSQLQVCPDGCVMVYISSFIE